MRYLLIGLFAAILTPFAGASAQSAALGSDIAARVSAGKDSISGRDQCHFVQIPDLLLVSRSEVTSAPARAYFAAPTTEWSGITFTVRAREGADRQGFRKWDAIFPWPGFDVPSPTTWREPVGTVRNTLLLDGRDSGFTAERMTGPPSRINPTFILKNPRDDSPGALIDVIASMDATSTLTWKFLDSDGRTLANYDFDIRTLRLMPDALVAAEWACS